MGESGNRESVCGGGRSANSRNALGIDENIGTSNGSCGRRCSAVIKACSTRFNDSADVIDGGDCEGSRKSVCRYREGDDRGRGR